MKKMLLTISLSAGILMVVSAQEVQSEQERRITPRTNPQPAKMQDAVDSQSVNMLPPPPATPTQLPQPTERVEYRTENLERLQAVEVPPVLRKTLEDAKYEGWEDGSIFRSTVNKHYVLEIQDGAVVRKFYFDENGKPVED